MNTLVAVKFSVQLLSRCCSALEPFPWSKTSLVSTIFSHKCSPFHKKKTCSQLFLFSTLQWKEETLLQYSTCTVQLGQFLQVPSVCCVLPRWVCVGLSHSTAGEKDKDSPKVSGAAKGCGYSVQCLPYQFKVLLLLEQMGWHNSVGLGYNVASGAGIPLIVKNVL